MTIKILFSNQITAIVARAVNYSKTQVFTFLHKLLLDHIKGRAHLVITIVQRKRIVAYKMYSIAVTGLCKQGSSEILTITLWLRVLLQNMDNQ